MYFRRYDLGGKDSVDATDFACAEKRKPMTNADKLRSMSDEELAHFLEMKAGRFVSFYPTQAKSWLDWLRQEDDK